MKDLEDIRKHFEVPDEFALMDSASDVNKAEILDNLRQFAAATKGHAISMRAYDRWPYRIRSAQAVVERFGTTWCDVCHEAGLYATRRSSRVFTPHDLVQHLLLAYADTALNPKSRKPNVKLIQAYARKHRLPLTKSPFEKHWHSVHRCWHQVTRFLEEQIDYPELLKPLAPLARSGKLYLFTDGEHYKVGRTRVSAEARRKQQQTGNARTVQIVHEVSLKDALHMDQAIKQRFKDKKVNGEWYALDADDLDWLKVNVFKVKQ